MTDQSKQNPFSFVTANGMFCTPWSEAVISVHALNFLSQQLDSPTTLPKQRLAITALLDACQRLPTEKTYSQTQKNDVPANELVPSRYQPERYPFTGCEKLHHIIMTLNTPKPTFQPNSYHPAAFTDQPKTWGWSDMLSLVPHFKVLSDLARAHGVTINVSALKRAIKNQALFEAGELKLRSKSAIADLGRGPAWVVYLPSSQTYADAQWNGASITAARLFESAAAAEKALGSRRMTGKASVVEVGISITKIQISAGLTSENAAPLQEALSVIERDKIEDALRHCDIDALRARVQELEQAQGISPKNLPSAPRSKRM